MPQTKIYIFIFWKALERCRRARNSAVFLQAESQGCAKGNIPQQKKQDKVARMGSIMRLVHQFWDPLYHRIEDQHHHQQQHHLSSHPPRVDWVETPQAHVLKIDLPGLKKEDIKVEVETGGALKVSGESKGHEGEIERWHRFERAVGNFFRRFQLPQVSKVEDSTAHLDSGVLTITVPKHPSKEPEARRVEISA